MTVEEFDHGIQTAMSEWAQSFKEPTEAFKAKMDGLIAQANSAGLDKAFMAVAMLKSMSFLENELERVVGCALTPEMMIVVDHGKPGS